METKTLTEIENLLVEMLLLVAELKKNGEKNINAALLFKTSFLHLAVENLKVETNNNYIQLEAAAFERYKTNVRRVFNGYIKSFGLIFQHNQDYVKHVAELIPGEPAPFKLEEDYPLYEVGILIHKLFSTVEVFFLNEYAEPLPEIEINKLNTINEKLLLLKYTGIYEQLKLKFGDNGTRIAKLINIIIGHDNAGSIRVILSCFNEEQKGSRLSPYTVPAISSAITILNQLKIDTTELNKILADLIKKDS